jgi:gas vesicle protein
MAIGSMSRDDILEALGLETRGSWIGAAATAFGIGLAIGAAGALLLAPKSGSELRDDLANRVGRMRERVREEGGVPRTSV